MERNKRRISDSMVEQVYQVRPEHLNGAGRLFGGKLMEWIDEIAGLVAMRHSRSKVVTASVDNLIFIRGAYQNDLLVLIGKVVYVGNTSMEIRVDTYIEDLEGMRRPINRAYRHWLPWMTMECQDRYRESYWKTKMIRQNGKQERNEKNFGYSEKEKDFRRKVQNEIYIMECKRA